MSRTELVQTSSVKVGNYLGIGGKPCKVISMSAVKPGKHGSSKTLFQARDLLSGKNVEHFAPSKGTVTVPEVVREAYTVLDVSHEGFLTLMKNGSLREDVPLPNDEIGEEVKRLLQKDAVPEITLMTVLGNDIVTNVKEDQSKSL